MNKLNDPAYKDLLDWMKANGVSLTYESGRASTYNGHTFSITNVDGNPNEPWIDPTPRLYPDNMTGYVHCHYLGLLRTFSASDLVIPFYWYFNNKLMDLGSFSFGLVNPDGSVYFLFITDIGKYFAIFENQAALLGTNVVEEIVKGVQTDLEAFYKIFGIDENIGDLDAANKLAALLQKMNIGMTMMKMNPFGTGFKEMKYNDTTGNVTEVECRIL